MILVESSIGHMRLWINAEMHFFNQVTGTELDNYGKTSKKIFTIKSSARNTKL